jgi:hypothetical protein
LTKEVDETFDDVTGEILGADACHSRRSSRASDRGRPYRRRTRQVLLEPASLAARQGAVEIVAHQFNGVATHEW